MYCLPIYSFEWWFAKGQCKSYIHSTQESAGDLSQELNKTSLVAELVKILPATQETWVQVLGQGNPLEKKMATHSPILAWRTPWSEEPRSLQSMGSQESDMT